MGLFVTSTWSKYFRKSINSASWQLSFSFSDCGHGFNTLRTPEIQDHNNKKIQCRTASWQKKNVQSIISLTIMEECFSTFGKIFVSEGGIAQHPLRKAICTFFIVLPSAFFFATAPTHKFFLPNQLCIRARENWIASLRKRTSPVYNSDKTHPKDHISILGPYASPSVTWENHHLGKQLFRSYRSFYMGKLTSGAR